MPKSKPGTPIGLGLGMPSSRESSLYPPSLSTPSSSHSHSLRSQIGSLIPRHALFQVHVHIDQLSSVPLVKGEFGVRWKFKNVQSGSGLLAKMKRPNGSKSESGSGSGSRESSSSKIRKSFGKKGKWKGKGLDFGLGLDGGSGEHSGHTPEGPQIEVSQEDQDSMNDSDHTTNEGHDDDPGTAKWGERPNGSGQLRVSASASSLFIPFISSSPPQSPTTPPTAVPDFAPLPPAPASAAPTITKANFSQMSGGSQLQTEAKGRTEWAPLENYNVNWDHKVSVVVQMDVHRETGDLLPNELKLVVMQRVVHGDPDSPRHPRLGALYLNLAEYANAGAVTRRYLLRESKTNATLKLTIDLEYIGGTKHYKPPPLPKSEILAEVSGLLTNNGLLRTRLARNLDLYSRGDDSDDNDNSSQRSHSLTPCAMPYTNVEGNVDYDRLAILNGLHTTENLIEAIFNPVPTASATPSPFTYYNPVKAKARELELTTMTASSSADTDSADTSADSSSGSAGLGNGVRTGSGKAYPASEHSSVSQDSSSHGSGLMEKPHWWQKIGGTKSRPGTPSSRQFVHAMLPRMSSDAESSRVGR